MEVAKTALRSEIKRQKELVGAERKMDHARKVFGVVESMEEFKQAKTVLVFWSLPDEIYTHDFIMKWAGLKHIALPVMVGDYLELRLFSSKESLVKSSNFSIFEPSKNKLVEPDQVDFAIIPGVAFDMQGNRLGRGKGYYDKLLPKLNKAIKVGVGYNFQLVGQVPVAEHDVMVDRVVCM